MKSKIIFSCIFFVKIISLHAQDSIPILRGKMMISVKKGTVDCDLTLNNIPFINDYFIRINSGMNILYIRNGKTGKDINYDKSFFDTLSSGETNAYYFKANRRGKFLPPSLHFRYTSKFPVTDPADTLNASSADWRGNIAFNGYSFRADGYQSGWYPMLYDIKKDKLLNEIKYDMDIDCSDCKEIYLNGSVPVKGPRAHLKSDIPFELTLFAGNYKVKRVGDTYFLNPDVKDDQLKIMGNFTNDVKKYYADSIGIPYSLPITYVHTTPTSRYDDWLFVSYPSIFQISRGSGFASFFDEKGKEEFRHYMSHELAHYYFGQYRHYNSTMGDMITEGFAEFLSQKSVKHFSGDSVYRKIFQRRVAQLGKFTPVPFGNISAATQYDNRELYSYYYTPLILTAVEKEIGGEKMWMWVKALLQMPASYADYAFFENTLRAALNDDAMLELIKRKYFFNDASVKNAEEELKGNY